MTALTVRDWATECARQELKIQALAAELAESRAAFEALNLLTRESADQLRQERNTAEARVQVLEAALRTVREIISNDSVEYDDVRNAEQIIDKALEPTQSSQIT